MFSIQVVTPALGYVGDKVGYRNVLIFMLLGNLIVNPSIHNMESANSVAD